LTSLASTRPVWYNVNSGDCQAAGDGRAACEQMPQCNLLISNAVTLLLCYNQVKPVNTLELFENGLLDKMH